MEFDALLVGDGESVKVGAPIVDGVKVKAKVDSVVKGKKIIVYKFKPKKNYRKKTGHRPVSYTHLRHCQRRHAAFR